MSNYIMCTRNTVTGTKNYAGFDGTEAQAFKHRTLLADRLRAQGLGDRFVVSFFEAKQETGPKRAANGQFA